MDRTQGFPTGTQGGCLEEQGAVIAGDVSLWDDPTAHCSQLSQRFHAALGASEHHCLRMRSDLVPKQPLAWPLAKE